MCRLVVGLVLVVLRSSSALEAPRPSQESPSPSLVAVSSTLYAPRRPVVPPLSRSRAQGLNTGGGSVVRGWAAADVVRDYRTWASSNYLAAAACQAGVLRSVANLVAQCMLVSRSQQDEVRLSTALTMGALGASVSGIGGASWQRFLEQRLGRSVGRGRAADVASKAALDFFLWAPVANAAYLLGLSMMRGECFGDAWNGLTRCFAHVMLLEAALFVPYSAFAFRTLPLELRPLASSCVGAAFTIGLSMMAC